MEYTGLKYYSTKSMTPVQFQFYDLNVQWIHWNQWNLPFPRFIGRSLPWVHGHWISSDRVFFFHKSKSCIRGHPLPLSILSSQFFHIICIVELHCCSALISNSPAQAGFLSLVSFVFPRKVQWFWRFSVEIRHCGYRRPGKEWESPVRSWILILCQWNTDLSIEISPCQ